MNRRMGFDRRRADGLRYPRRAILYVRIYWLEQRRSAYAAGGSVLECGHADTVHQKGEPTREMERTHMRCRFCDPIAAAAFASLLAVLMLVTGCGGPAFTASELAELGGSSSSAAGVAGAELERAGGPAMGGTAGATSTSVGGVAGAELGGSSSSSGAAGAPTDAELCGCKEGALSGDEFCPAADAGCLSLVCAGDVGHCFQVCGGVCK